MRVVKVSRFEVKTLLLLGVVLGTMLGCAKPEPFSKRVELPQVEEVASPTATFDSRTRGGPVPVRPVVPRRVVRPAAS